ncbi:MAG: adenylate/guanylate cyclase domain-containing protein [Steroidobacteraceae bacterium]
MSRLLILSPADPNAAYAHDCLSTLGMSASGCNSAAEVREQVHAGWVDLLIVGENARALEVTASLKGDSTTLLVPILAVCNTDAEAMAAIAAGADDAVTRSAGPRSLLAVAEALVDQGSIRRRIARTVLNRERMVRDRIRSTICRYLSPQLADRMLLEINATEPLLPQHSTSTRAAVMFADMRGFTSMAERLGPGDTLRVLNEYFSMLAEIAFRHDGTIFNMSGDSLMIGYGVPVEQQDSPARAVRTASEMLTGFRDLARQWRDRHDIHVGLGIGINDGEVLTGDVGSSQYMSYTMIGDTVNVAARLSQRARAGEVLFSGSVKRALDARGYDVGAVALPPLTLRGRSGPVDIYCVPLGERQLTDA